MIFARTPEHAKRSYNSSFGTCTLVQSYTMIMLAGILNLFDFIFAEVTLSWSLLQQFLAFCAGFEQFPKAATEKSCKVSSVSSVSPLRAEASDRDTKVPHLDFAMPMKSVGMITRAVVEGIHKHYAPRRLYVICEQSEAAIISKVSMEWNIPCDFVVCVDEEQFFVKSFNMRKEDFLPFYDHGRDRSLTREFGWWWQQLLKLGCASCIENISEDFIVWDSDLVVIEPWPLELTGLCGPVHYAAVLQESARSSFNRLEYEGSVRHVLGLDAAYPQPKGTYVSHHMPMNRVRGAELVALMDARLPGNLPWPAKLLQTSTLYYRMSEYMLYSTFEMARQKAGQPAKWSVHAFESYGARGFRHREPKAFMDSLQEKQGVPWSGFA